MPAPTLITSQSAAAPAASRRREILRAAAREILAPARREILVAEHRAGARPGRPAPDPERPRPERERELPFDTVEQGFEWILTGRLRVWKE